VEAAKIEKKCIDPIDSKKRKKRLEAPFYEGVE